MYSDVTQPFFQEGLYDRLKIYFNARLTKISKSNIERYLNYQP